MISLEAVKSLRDKTGVSIALCKKALEEAKGDEKKAMLILRKKGSEAAEKKSGRALGAGTIVSYIHGEGKVGVLLELSTETDFVSKTDEFKALARELAMQVAATNPKDGAELLAQSSIRNPEHSVKDLLDGAIQKFGEKIAVSRFSRYSLN